jgi:hypothetical protein
MVKERGATAMVNQEHPDYEQVFPVGAKVRCENECWPGRWDRGTVKEHLETRFNVSWAIRIETEAGELVDFDYRYLDVDPHNSLVRLVK